MRSVIERRQDSRGGQHEKDTDEHPKGRLACRRSNAVHTRGSLDLPLVVGTPVCMVAGETGLPQSSLLKSDHRVAR